MDDLRANPEAARLLNEAINAVNIQRERANHVAVTVSSITYKIGKDTYSNYLIQSSKGTTK